MSPLLHRGMAMLSALPMHLAVGLMTFMALLGFADVVWANLFKSPVPAANDVASAILPLVVVLAMCHTQRRDGHICVDLVTNLLPSSMDRALRIIGYGCASIALIAIAWGAWSSAIDSVEIGEVATAAIRFPIWPSKVVFAIGLTLVAFQAVIQLVGCLAGRSASAKERR